MTDPRIVECAKAMCFDDGTNVGFCVALKCAANSRCMKVPDPRDLHQATACVLKWLEQEPTTEMLAAIARCVSRGDTSARAALSCYTDIQAAARAEIAK